MKVRHRRQDCTSAAPGPTAVGTRVVLASGSRWSSADLLAGGGVNSEWSEAEVGCGAAVCFQRGPIISMTDMLERAIRRNMAAVRSAG